MNNCSVYYQEYITEKSIPLIAQPCKKYLRRWWKVRARPQGGAQGHKHVNHVNRKTYKNGEACSKWRQVVISTWSLPLILVHKVKSNSSSRSPDSFVSFWIWQWKITFTNCRGLESATWVDNEANAAQKGSMMVWLLHHTMWSHKTYLACDDYDVNIIIKVMYFLQGCATLKVRYSPSISIIYSWYYL